MDEPCHPRSPAVQRALRELHAEVDRRAGALAARHGPRLRCRAGCAACCVDGIAVFEVEADRIRAAHAGLLAGGAPRGDGACAFLDEGGSCRVYADRPYVCRTQGLPLRWTEEVEPGQWVEYRDICPLNDGPDTAAGEVAVEELEPELCWSLGPFEERLALLQAVHSAGPGARVPLRSLFARG